MACRQAGLGCGDLTSAAAAEAMSLSWYRMCALPTSPPGAISTYLSATNQVAERERRKGVGQGLSYSGVASSLKLMSYRRVMEYYIIIILLLLLKLMSYRRVMEYDIIIILSLKLMSYRRVMEYA